MFRILSGKMLQSGCNIVMRRNGIMVVSRIFGIITLPESMAFVIFLNLYCWIETARCAINILRTIRISMRP